MGYHRAGFDVVGVDIEKQPRYPFTFVQADALEYVSAHWSEFDVIHASPPCQHYSTFTPLRFRGDHPDLIAAVRAALRLTEKPYVIENVSGARFELDNPFMLCGSMFGLPIWRHRWFEIWPARMVMTPTCQHNFKPVLITDHGGPNANGWGKPRKHTPTSVKRAAAGIDWMTEDELSEAVPPTYTQFIGAHLLAPLAVSA